MPYFSWQLKPCFVSPVMKTKNSNRQRSVKLAIQQPDPHYWSSENEYYWCEFYGRPKWSVLQKHLPHLHSNLSMKLKIKWNVECFHFSLSQCDPNWSHPMQSLSSFPGNEQNWMFSWAREMHLRAHLQPKLLGGSSRIHASEWQELS